MLTDKDAIRILREMRDTEISKCKQGGVMATIAQTKADALERAISWAALQWTPADELPELDEDGCSKPALLSFDNCDGFTVGEYRQEPDGSGAWYDGYDGDNDRSLASYGLFVNGWMVLPERRKSNDGGQR